MSNGASSGDVYTKFGPTGLQCTKRIMYKMNQGSNRERWPTKLKPSSTQLNMYERKLVFHMDTRDKTVINLSWFTIEISVIVLDDEDKNR